MTTLSAAPRTGREVARFLNSYARQYSAGAFATPTAAELERTGWHWWPPGVAAAGRTLTRDTARTDFTGRRYVLPAGSSILTHLAAAPGAPLPVELDRFDYVFAYVEDTAVTRGLTAMGREVVAVRVSAASEIIACWGRPGTGHRYPAVDRATLVQIPVTIGPAARAAVAEEVRSITSWHDDFPYYSDGSWDAVSLRGFNPTDPTYGIKPAEMSKSWWAEHPEARRYDRCDWTVMADRCPAAVSLVQEVAWWGDLERVRLLRMAGRGGKGGSLARHSDVTDRAAGTRDGQIVRFHIPLITHPDITMSAWNLRGERFNAHLPAWTLWYLDARKPHAVDNRAGIDRIHLVIDLLCGPHARQVITADGHDVAA